MKEFTIFLHWKQGDELRDILEEANQDVPKAFKKWSKIFNQRAEYCQKMADRLQDHDVQIEADTHHIGLHGDEEFLHKLAEEDLINEHEIDVVEDQYFK